MMPTQIDVLRAERSELESRREVLAQRRTAAAARQRDAQSALAEGLGTTEAVVQAAGEISAFDGALAEVDQRLAAVDAAIQPFEDEARRNQARADLRQEALALRDAIRAMLTARERAAEALNHVITDALIAPDGYRAARDEVRACWSALTAMCDRFQATYGTADGPRYDLETLEAAGATEDLRELNFEIPGVLNPISRHRVLDPLPELNTWTPVLDQTVGATRVVEE
jgi:hypothetical protein